MAKAETTHDLERVVREIEAAANESGLEVIHGQIDEPEDSAKIICDNDRFEGHGNFIRQAKRIGCAFIVLYVVRLDEDDLDEAIESAEASGECETRTDILEILKGCKSRIGQIAQIVVQYWIPATLVRAELEFHSEWLDAVYETEELLEQDEETDGQDNGSLSDAQIEEIARELAGIPRFQSAKNRDARMLEGKKFLRGKLEGSQWNLHLREIIQIAKSIYETEND